MESQPEDVFYESTHETDVVREQETLEEKVMTTRTEVFIKENGISLKQHGLTKEEIIESVSNLLAWIHGPGLKLLDSQRDLPRDFREANEIRKSHEQFEFKCMQALATYAKIRDIRSDENEVNEHLDRLENTVRDFLQQLQYRRQVVLSCYTFFRLHEELLAYVGEINSLLTRRDFVRIEETEQYVNQLEKALKYAENLFQQLFMESEKIKSIISVQEIITIVTTLVTENKMRLTKEFEILKIRILETKKMLQLLIYDRDARQSVIWLEDLIRILIESYRKYNVGKTPMETADLVQQYYTFESKAKETYNYAKELLISLTNMYRQQGKSTETCHTLLNGVEIHWQRLQLLLKEVGDRYQVADTFHKNVDNILERIEKVILLISRDLDNGKNLEQVRKLYGQDRNEIVRDYETTKKIGIALMERIRHAIQNEKETLNITVVDEVEDVIKMKLFTLWLKIRELYYYLGQVIEIDEITERWEMMRISIDKLYERMAYWFGHWKEGNLPVTIPEAEHLIEEHDRARKEIQRLWEQVDMDLSSIAKMSQSEDIADLAVKAQDDATGRKNEWMHRWQVHKEKLDLRYQLLLELRDMEIEISKLNKSLDDGKAEPVEDIETVRRTNRAILQLSDNVPTTENKIENLFNQVQRAVGQDFHMHTSKIDEAWKKFLKDLELFQMFIELILRMLEFIEILYKFINDLKVSLPQCRTRQEAEPWFQKIQEFNKKSSSFDCDWLTNVAQRLYKSGEKPRPVIEKLRQIFASLSLYESEIMEMVTVESITLVHSKNKQLKFFRELEDITIQEGQRCILEVEYSGSQSAEVEWMRNRRPLPTQDIGGKWFMEEQEGFTRIVCDKTLVADAGNFNCRIRDGGMDIETACTVKVVSQPFFTQELSNANVEQDEPVLFQCQVKGHPVPRIEWYKNDQLLRRNYEFDIDNQDGICALKISSASGSNAGRYTCKAVNDAGEAITTAKLQVKEFRPCRFIRKLVDDTELYEEERLRLRVEFEGDPAPEVTWFKDNVKLEDKLPSRIICTDKDYSILTIDPVTEDDNGIYAVQLKNKAGRERCISNVTIKTRGESARFLTPLMDENITEGSPLQLHCRITGKPQPQVTWFKDNRPLTRAGRHDIQFINNPESGNYSLELSETRLNDEGEYRVIAENSEGRVETKCYVTIDPLSDETPTPMAPRFSGDINEELFAHVSDKVTLQCTVHGYPMPTVTWIKDNIKIYTDEHIIISGFEESHSLVIPYVRAEDEGVYKIIASNQVGSAECICTLTVVDDELEAKRTTLVFHNTVVKSPPEFIRLFRDEFCKVGDSVALECEIDGIPDPTVWWSFNGETIEENDRRFRMTTTNGNVYTLFIKKVTSEETGRYSVTAENSSGVATCSALLIVEELGRTGSYEHWARSSSRASNSRPITPNSFRPITPTATNISYLSGKHNEQLHHVEVTPRFDIQSPKSPSLHQHSPSQLSPAYRIETHNIDYHVSDHAVKSSNESHFSRKSGKEDDAIPFSDFSSKNANQDKEIHYKSAKTEKVPEFKSTEKVERQPFEAVERDVKHEISTVHSKSETNKTSEQQELEEFLKQAERRRAQKTKSQTDLSIATESSEEVVSFKRIEKTSVTNVKSSRLTSGEISASSDKSFYQQQFEDLYKTDFS